MLLRILSESPDEINQIDWMRKSEFSLPFIALEKNHPAFRIDSLLRTQSPTS